MARARNIKPGFFKNEYLGTADPFVSLLFAGLWTLADKAGIIEDRPLRIKAELFPYRDGFDINGYLTVLLSFGLINRYQHNGVKLIQIANFKKHQNPHHTEKDSEYPDYSDTCQESVKQPLINRGAPADSLIPDSLIPDSLNPIKTKEARVPRFDAKTHLIELGVEDSIADDWITLRKAKKAAVTKTAIDGIQREAIKAGFLLADALRECCSRGWVGFKSEWLLKPHSGGSVISWQDKKQAADDATNKAMRDFAAGISRERLICGEVV